MNCPHCSGAVQAGQRFCGQCGQALAAAGGQCGQCGKELGPGQRFCGNCGASAAGSGPLPPTGALQPAADVTGDRRIVTVLFTDVSGFTAMSEKLDPEAVTEIINNFFKVLVEPIYRYGGVVDKYIGDAIMALFGAPVAHEDDAERAVRAAWEMQQRAQKHAEALEKQTGILLKVRIGLNTGLVVAGQVGASQRSDYTVMGDTVNLAQRMESNARVGKVLVTAETYQQTRHAFRFEALAAIKVKGKAEPVDVFELAGPVSRTRALGTEEEVFVGRQLELQTLDAYWSATMQGRPHLVMLAGEAGVGKSATARRLVKRMLEDQADIRYARCPSYELQTAYAMVSDLLRSWIGVSDQDPASRTRSALESFVAKCAPDDERALALLGHLLALEVDNPDVASLSPRQARTGAFITLDDIVVSLARKGPVVLFLEDLHWADEASVEWLCGLLERVSTENGHLPLLVLCQTRSELPTLRAAAERLPGTQLSIGPLLPADIETMATLHLGATIESLPGPVQSVVTHALDRAEGNPFYLAEVLRALTEGGILVRSGATWTMGKAAEGILPTSVRGAVSARLDRLSVASRQLLQTAAVIGKRFTRELLASVLGREVDPLDELLTQKLLFVRGEEIGFTQTLIWEVAYETLLISHRRELHRKVGAALEDHAGPDVGPNAATIAEHFIRAEDAPRAAHYLYLAADHARASSAIAEAMDFYRKALEWHATEQDEAGLKKSAGQDPAKTLATAAPVAFPKAEVLLQMALLETLRGELETAISHLDAHEALAGRSVRSIRARGDVLERAGDFTGALATYREAGELAVGQSLEQARVWASEGNILRRMGEYEAAIALCHKSYVELEAAQQPAEAAFVHGVLGISYHRMNDFESALREHSAALRLREKAGDIDGVAKTHNNLGMLAVSIGRWTEAYQHYSRALAMFRKLGDRPHLAMMLNNLGDLLLKQGDDAMAERHFQEAYKLAAQMGDRMNALTALGNLGFSLLSRGIPQEALSQLDACLVQAAEAGHNEFGPELQLGRARAFIALKDPDAASAALDLAVAESAGNTQFMALVDQVRSELALAAGDREEALELARRSMSVLRDSGMQLELGRTLILLVQVAPIQEAESHAREALELLSRLGARKELQATQQAWQERASELRAASSS